MTPLIHPDNIWALWAVIAAGPGTAIWLEQTDRDISGRPGR
jgi:hypothetical protein